MRLTRRDAIIAAGSSGFVTAAASILIDSSMNSDKNDRGLPDQATPGELSTHSVETLHALTEVLYPSEVEVTNGFVETYVNIHPMPWKSEIQAAISSLDSLAKDWAGQPLKALSKSHRDTLLREQGINRVQASPTGTTPQRIRYYIVDGLLFALYSTPKGSRLVGIDNPRGHPGGFTSITEPATTR